MSRVRAHLVAVVAVFLALAVGVVLGGGPLSDVADPVAAVAADSADSESSDSPPDAAAVGAAGDAFAAAVAPRVLRDGLAGRTVAVVALPGADEDLLDALDARVEDAGGQVTRRYEVTETLLEPGEKQLVDTLGRQLSAEYGRGAVERSAPPYERLGQLLALAVASGDRSADPVGARSASVLASLAGAGVVAAGPEPRRRAALVLVVVGDEPVAVLDDGSGQDDAGGTDGDSDGDGGTGEGAGEGTHGGTDESEVEELEASTDAIVDGLLVGLRDGSAGVLLAGSTESGADGVLARLRAADGPAGVATLDGVETTAGQVSAPLVLARALRGNTGAYGAAGSDGAVPLR